MKRKFLNLFFFLSDKAAEVEIKDAEEEEDADEPENFEETMDAASESEE